MTPYQLQKQRRRTIISFSVAFLFHLLLLGGYFLYAFLSHEELNEYSGPVLIKLGEPDIPETDEESKPLEEQVLAEASVDPEPQHREDDSEPEIKEEAEVLIPREDPVPPKESSPETQEAPLTETVSQPEEVQAVVVDGSEAGNSYKYEYFAEEGLVRRGIGSAIYLFMPLPKVVDAVVFNQVQGESYTIGKSKKAYLLQYYTQFDELYYYEDNAPDDEVSAIWDYLIQAGYDYKNADYKSGRLNPVVISFTISADARLLDVAVEKSSGISEVDEAVLKGFMDAGFTNSGDRKIKGKFTYRFD